MHFKQENRTSGKASSQEISSRTGKHVADRIVTAECREVALAPLCRAGVKLRTELA